MGEERMQMPHRLALDNRKQLTVTGVTEVVSFDENAVMLRTGQGDLLIQGSGLQLRQLSLDGGQVAVDGTVAAMVYEEPRPGGWLRRILG